jgi:hypothetical protein
VAIVVSDGELDSPVAADVPRSVRRLGNEPAKFEQRVPFRAPGNAKRPDAQFARRSRGTFAAALEAVKILPVKDVEIVELSVSRSRKAGGYHLMTAQNPVYLFSFQGGQPDE